VLHLAYIGALAISLSFGVTQVPLLYVFRVMTCEAYYKTHPSPPPSPDLPDRCSIREIEAGTARSVAILGASTTIFGLLNLLVTGWGIKRFGVKAALFISVFWPAARLAVQNVGVMTGGALGILIVQCSQILTIVGGPNGYVLALNSFVTDVVRHEERTGAIGRLQGCMLVGSAVGFLAGGLLGDGLGILAPFRITLVLFLLCSVYVAVCLPSIPAERDVAKEKVQTGFSRFVGPLHVFAPQKWVLPDGRVKTYYGVLALGSGVFLAILATGYIPTILQMYSTDEFGFGTRENGVLIFMYSSLRGLYLTFVFPVIIATGRKWMRRSETRASHKTLQESEIERGGQAEEQETHRAQDEEDEEPQAEPGFQTPLLQPTTPAIPASESDPTSSRTNTVGSNTASPYTFDLLYARLSLALDALITTLFTLVSTPHQIFFLSAILPLAAGTGSASKGALLHMLPSSQRVDALAGITLVENVARLSTTAVFGSVFAALQGVGRGWCVFVANAGVAATGVAVLCFVRFLPGGSRVLEDGR
jgi:hypothetical protein